MKENKKILGSKKLVKSDFLDRIREKSWTYIRTVVDVVHEPILVLDKDLRVMVANDPFYSAFQVDPKDTEGRLVYKLGNGQWDISSLRKLLEDILPKNTFFKGFEVDHEFPFIGRKVMILNARQIHFQGDTVSELFPPIILLAIEDVTEMMGIAKTLAEHTDDFELRMAVSADKLGLHIKELEKEVDMLKKRLM
jgi:PAS domain-containing protein